MTHQELARQARREARTRLLTWLKPGDTVYTILRHVSRSGLQREIGVVLLHATCAGCRGPLTTKRTCACGERWPVQVEDYHPNYAVSTLLGRRLASGNRDGIRCSGSGMDMGFELVYELGLILWPSGFDCLGADCPSNDHQNGDHPPSHHANGGYALRHHWL